MFELIESSIFFITIHSRHGGEVPSRQSRPALASAAPRSVPRWGRRDQTVCFHHIASSPSITSMLFAWNAIPATILRYLSSTFAITPSRIILKTICETCWSSASHSLHALVRPGN